MWRPHCEGLFSHCEELFSDCEGLFNQILTWLRDSAPNTYYIPELLAGGGPRQSAYATTYHLFHHHSAVSTLEQGSVSMQADCVQTLEPLWTVGNIHLYLVETIRIHLLVILMPRSPTFITSSHQQQSKVVVGHIPKKEERKHRLPVTSHHARGKGHGFWSSHCGCLYYWRFVS